MKSLFLWFRKSLTSGWFAVLLVSCLIKLLAFPAYYSTDFEVHRNWLRITGQLQPREWYFDTKSIWTLDYPPLFAYFEFILSRLSLLIDPTISTSVDEFSSENTVVFQRTSVMASEIIVFGTSLMYFRKHIGFGTKKVTSLAAVGLVFLQFGFFLVDHVHFQYNAFLQGILVFALAKLHQGHYLSAALLFTLVLNFKHIFLYAAPVFFFLLLRNYCFIEQLQKKHLSLLRMFQFKKFLFLVGCVLSVFIISFFPFIDLTILTQILSRLFPFQRGLVHAYWAPNAWALYCTFDKVVGFIVRSVLKMPLEKQSTLSSGVVQITKFDVLPTITPLTTLFLIILVSAPLWWRIWRERRNDRVFLYASCQMLIFFMFGFHVHEKAILLPLGIYQLSALLSSPARRKFSLLFSFVNGVGLLPLLPLHSETSVKLGGLVIYHMVLWAYTKRDMSEGLDQEQSKDNEVCLTYFEKSVLFLAFAVALYGNVFHFLLFSGKQFEFLPLILHSTFCATMNMYFTASIMWEVFNPAKEEQTTQQYKLLPNNN